MWIFRRARRDTRGSNREAAAGGPAVPQGQRIYAFGDVHGRADLVDRCRTAILKDWRATPSTQMIVVGLGDYVDRGPSSRAVVETLATRDFPGLTVYLRGNHEQLLIDFLEDPIRIGPVWLENGGLDTLRSYAVTAVGRRRTFDFQAIRSDLVARLPLPHLLFLQGLPVSYEAGDYFFVHAGARPGVPLARQRIDDLLWIRRGFSDRDEHFEKVVVHGHTPVKEPFVGNNRINLDTGAYLTDRLTCMVFEGHYRRFLKL